MSISKSLITIVTLAAAALAWSLPAFTGEEPGTAATKAGAKEGEAPTDVAAGNILLNPGLEEGEKTPASWTRGAEVDGVEYRWDRTLGQQGKASLCLNKTANRYFPIAQWYQIVDRKPEGRTLKVSAQVKAEKASKAIIDVVFLDENSEWVIHEWVCYIGAKKPNDPPANHDWKEYSGTLKIPEKARKIQIGLQIYGPGKVWFDEVRAEYVK